VVFPPEIPLQSLPVSHPWHHQHNHLVSPLWNRVVLPVQRLQACRVTSPLDNPVVFPPEIPLQSLPVSHPWHHQHNHLVSPLWNRAVSLVQRLQANRLASPLDNLVVFPPVIPLQNHLGPHLGFPLENHLVSPLLNRVVLPVQRLQANRVAILPAYRPQFPQAIRHLSRLASRRVSQQMFLLVHRVSRRRSHLACHLVGRLDSRQLNLHQAPRGHRLVNLPINLQETQLRRHLGSLPLARPVVRLPNHLHYHLGTLQPSPLVDHLRLPLQWCIMISRLTLYLWLE
jgi:hypothetical protein